MDLMFNFSSEKWENNPNLKSTDCPEGWKKYHIMGHKNMGPGKWTYSIADMQDNSLQAWLEGASGKKDPLTGIGNIGIKLGGEDGHQIVGLMAYEDCIEMKK